MYMPPPVAPAKTRPIYKYTDVFPNKTISQNSFLTREHHAPEKNDKRDVN